jgi:hypothetical protein
MKVFKLLIVGLYIFLIVGYVKCVYKLIKADFEPSYKREIVYGIGTVTGLGVIIGWFDIPDTINPQNS